MSVRTYVRMYVCMHVFLDGWMNFCWFACVDTHVYLRASLSTQTTIEIYCSLLKLLLRFGMYCFLEQMLQRSEFSKSRTNTHTHMQKITHTHKHTHTHTHTHTTQHTHAHTGGRPCGGRRPRLAGRGWRRRQCYVCVFTPAQSSLEQAAGRCF